jgi:RNA polymerase sigma-70 factor (ECF subfamily)
LDRNVPAVDSDRDLVRQISAGSEDALRKLYAAYGQRLYAYALRITGDPAAAEEAVQESLVAVWQGAGRFRGESRTIAWLLGIVHHKALNQIRGKPVDSLEAQPLDPPAGDPLPDELAAAQEQRRLVRAGLERLSLEHRLVLELVFYQGLSLNEVAEVSGCPVGTVKSRLNYAKASLRGALSRAGLNAEDVEK